MTAAHAILATPVGELRVAATARGVCAVAWTSTAPATPALPATAAVTAGNAGAGAGAALAARAAAQLREYFEGERHAFDLPLDLAGVRPFYRRVLAEVARIPFGAAVSYGEVARRSGRPGAARAVGGAMAANPLPIIVPCHRVVRADGTPGDYSGGPAEGRSGGPDDPRGGTATKLWLLAFEYFGKVVLTV